MFMHPNWVGQDLPIETEKVFECELNARASVQRVTADGQEAHIRQLHCRDSSISDSPLLAACPN